MFVFCRLYKNVLIWDVTEINVRETETQSKMDNPKKLTTAPKTKSNKAKITIYIGHQYRLAYI
jgi:hypothetical protein